MTDTYAALLSSIGFPAADAAQQAGQIQRRLELGKSQVDLAGEDQRRQMAADYEGRGVTLSGEANQGYARQAARQQSQIAGLDLGATDDLFSLQRQLAQQQAQQTIQNESQAQQKALFDQQYQLNQQQLNQQLNPTAGIDVNAILQQLIAQIPGAQPSTP